MNNNPLIPSINSKEIPVNDLENLSKNQLKNFINSPDQTLIKFKDPVSFNLVTPDPEIPADVVQAMQGLVQIIAHLRSPNGAWPINLPQTPENLIPYVTEEVSEVLVAYQTHPISAPNISSGFFPKKDSNIQTPVILFLHTLISQLLWNFAQTSYQFMRLVTGINAEILLPHQDWTPGKLRLVASLIIKNENLQSSIDLATSDFSPPLITSEAYLQSNDCSFCQNPLEVQSFLLQITHHFQDNFQGFNLLNYPIQAELLSPGSQWEPIQMSIEIGFQFIPDPKTSEVTPFHYFLENTPVDEELFQNVPIQDVEYSILASISHSSLLKTHVRLTDPNIIQPYIQTQIQYYGLHGLQRKKHLQLTDSVKSSPELFLSRDSQTEESELIELIEIADELVDVIYSPKSPSSLIRLQPEIPLIDLSLRVLWQIIKSNYNVMQLMSGIQAKVLQPGFLWQTGTLRLLIVLSAEFLSDSWELDIATSQPLKFDLKPIIPESIVQSDWSEWCRSPQSLAVLKLQIINLLESIPELQSWMKGVKIDWGNSNEDLQLSTHWQSGLAQLSLDFEWIPVQPSPLE